MSHKALVCEITALRPIPGADRIQLAEVSGYNVIVGSALAVGDVGVFFDSELQLSAAYAQANDLVRRRDPTTGANIGGYFEENRRVRAIKMKGVKSEGYFAPLSSFAFTEVDLSQLVPGFEFDALNGVSICEKYLTPATSRQRTTAKASRHSDLLRQMFREHVETEQFKRYAAFIPVGAVVYLTVKLHGTSARLGHVLDETVPPMHPFKRLFYRLAKLDPPRVREWGHFNGSRRVILERRTGEGFYGKEEFRSKATAGIRLHKGEVLYGELVGFTETGAPIMAPQDTSRLKDRKFETAFGRRIVYRYGVPEGQCELWVYRITQVNEDGVSVDLSWPQVKKRCRELALKPVPELDRFIYDGDLDALRAKVDLLVEGADGIMPSRLDATHPEEGVVIRYESENGTGFLKAKSFAFGLLEGFLKEQDAFVDAEEAA